MNTYYITVESRYLVNAISEDEAKIKAMREVAWDQQESVKLQGFDITCCTEED